MGWFPVLRIGVSDLYHGGREIGLDLGIAVTAADSGVAAENVGTAVFAAKNSPFGEYGQPADGGTAAVSGDGIGQNPVVERNVDAVMMPIEGHRLHFDGGIEQFSASDLGTVCVVQNRL